jgi:hypothetical protein
MKKLIIRVLIGLVVVIILAVLGIGLFLDRIVKTGIETIGPRVTKVSVKLDTVSLSLFSGGGTIKGLVVGNPQGFKTPQAISVGQATLALEPGSLLSDKVIINTINLQAPEITYETDLKRNNLSQLLQNVQEAAGGAENKPQQPSEPKQAKPAKKLQVDDFLITGGKVHVNVTALSGGAATVALPNIHLKDLGKGPDGITAAELTKLVLDAIEKRATQAASGAIADIGKGAVYITKDVGNSGSNAVNNVTKGIGDLFKKK